MSRFSDFFRRAKNTSCSVVVVAAGASTRMGEDKLFMDLAGKPVLARTLAVLNTCDCVDEIVVVTRLESLEKVAALCREYRIHKVEKVVVGGATRTESALAGLVQIRRSAKYVLIHDGARPLVTEDIVRDALHGAALYKCAAPAVPVTDTVKEADHNTVVRTLDRSALAAIQTPQAFVPEIIKAALMHAIAEKKEYTDDCAAVEAMGLKVHLTKGSNENIKITGPVDLPTAAAILQARGE